jgi:hypothetical protein
MLTFIALWMIASWYAILPWIKEYQAQTKFAESETLNSAVEQISRLEEIGARVQSATASWQSAQDAAVRVTNVAKEIEERIKADSKDFMEFAERISNDDKQHLRLEVEKLRRSEAEWLQVAARILDHTFALTAAALRSGQPNLAAQMTNFQNACRDAARRVGLVAFHPGVGDPFDERSQQLEDANAKAEEGSVVSDILATGYTFQGQLLRKALVRISAAGAVQQTEPGQEQAAVAPAQPLEEEQRGVEEAQAALAEVAEEVHEQRRDEIQELEREASLSGAEVEETRLEQEQSGAESQVEEQAATLESRAPGEQVESQDQEQAVGSAEDFVVETYRPASEQEVQEAGLAEHKIDSEDQPESLSHESDRQDHNAIADEIAVGEPSDRAADRINEVASAETENPGATEEDRPRRRQRKPDPQTSLPF